VKVEIEQDVLQGKEGRKEGRKVWLTNRYE
jgi:hypothetical protein